MREVKLTKESPAVKHLCERDKRLSKVIDMVGDISYSVHEDGYEFLIGEIIEQMLSTKVARILNGRLENLCNGNVSIETINALSDDEIKSIGTSRRKIATIRSVTKAIETGEIDLNQLSSCSDQEVMKRLTSIYGIGDWTAKMYLIFVLDRSNILPYEDVAFLQSFEWIYKVSRPSIDVVKKKPLRLRYSAHSRIAAKRSAAAGRRRMHSRPGTGTSTISSSTMTRTAMRTCIS